jgi:hypothetical protein
MVQFYRIHQEVYKVLLHHRLAVSEFYKEEKPMGILVVVGLAFILLFIGGFFAYFLKGSLNSSDSSSIDPVPEDDWSSKDKTS